MPSLRRRQHPRPRLDHTTYGSLSATLAAAKLLGLSHEQTVHAMGIAGTTGRPCGSLAGELSMWKGCAFAFAARNGLLPPCGRDGMTGPAPLFEGEMGFFQQVSGVCSVPKLGGPDAEDWMLRRPPSTSVRPGSQPVGHRRGLRAAARDQRARGDPLDGDRADLPWPWRCA